MPVREYRVGIGVDVHPLSPERKFYVCGVCVSSTLGPVGHSDGDPVAHSLADALLGAGGLPDIGTIFPADDERYRNIPGNALLQETVKKVSSLGWEIESVDCVLWLEKPAISPFLENIRSALAQTLGLDIDQVGFKVKRGEGLGFVGSGEGTMAFSTALLTRPRMKRKKEQEKSVEIYTDGGSKGNPGPSACSSILSVGGKILYVLGESLGWTTNNVAEYCGVLLGMKEALKRGFERIVIHSDSELLIRQMTGEYEITEGKLRERAEEIREISREFRSVKWELISREENRLAHRIVELILEGEK